MPEAENSQPEQGTENEQNQTTENHQSQEGQARETEPKSEDLAKELEKWKSLSRQNEERAKRNAEAAKNWQEYENSRKTEEQKAQEERERIIAERDSAKLEAARYRAATEHGLSPEDLELLDGVPADQLEDRAARLAERLKPARTPSPSAGIGRETPPEGLGTGDWLRDRITQRK